MLDKVLLGRYLDLDSPIHHLDPRTKLLGSLYLILVVFFANNWLSYGLLALGILGIIGLSRIPIKFFLNGVKPIIGIIFFTVAFQIFFTSGGTVYFEWWIFKVTSTGLINGAYIFLRLVLIIFLSTILTLTTAPLELTDGIEHLLRPLTRFGFPAHEIALMLSIALRYVPTLLDEAQTIMNAQRSRGVDFDEGSLLERMQAIIPILVPLFVSAFNRAEEMAIAMEARGYRGSEGRTKYRQLAFNRSDLASVGYMLVMTGLVFWARSY